MAEVRWSLTAEADLRAIEDFIAQDSVLHAVDLVDRLIEGTEHLSDAPRWGASCLNSSEKMSVSCSFELIGSSIRCVGRL